MSHDAHSDGCLPTKKIINKGDYENLVAGKNETASSASLFGPSKQNENASDRIATDLVVSF